MEAETLRLCFEDMGERLHNLTRLVALDSSFSHLSCRM